MEINPFRFAFAPATTETIAAMWAESILSGSDLDRLPERGEDVAY
jgi:hypothetical protein